MKRRSLSSTKSLAFVLPTLLLLGAVVALLCAAVLNLGASSLRASTHGLGSDQALYAAEAGLVHASELLLEGGELGAPVTGELLENGSTYRVTALPNPTSQPMTVRPGFTIPGNSIYLLAEGASISGQRRVAGALFRTGLAGFEVGALVDRLTARNAHFDAYDSRRERAGYAGDGVDPDSLEPHRGILASNRRDGVVFSLTDTKVAGSIFVGPGGDPVGQVSQQGETVITSTGSLQNPIEPEEIELPELPKGEGDEEPFEPKDPLRREWFFGLLVNPTPSGTVEFGNSCFRMSVQPNGDFTAQEAPGQAYAGGTLHLEGNIHEIRAGGVPTVNSGSNRNGSTGFGLEIDEGRFSISGSWHTFSLDGRGQLVADGGPGTRIGDAQAGRFETRTYSGAPDWLVHLLTGSGPGVVAENPGELTPGTYDRVQVSRGETELRDGATYVIRDLIIEEGGRLTLPADRGEVKIYVTRSLAVVGEDAIANDSRRPPNLSIYYLGTDPVELAGGSRSYFTLYAPDADLDLRGLPEEQTEFFGALVGRSVTVENARFHYDVATTGVGLGAEASQLRLLSRHR